MGLVISEVFPNLSNSMIFPGSPELLRNRSLQHPCWCPADQGLLLGSQKPQCVPTLAHSLLQLGASRTANTPNLAAGFPWEMGPVTPLPSNQLCSEPKSSPISPPHDIPSGKGAHSGVPVGAHPIHARGKELLHVQKKLSFCRGNGCVRVWALRLCSSNLECPEKIFFVHLISGKYDLHARCLLLCICLPISSRSPFALCTLLGSDHSGAAPTQHTSLPFCISKPRTQPGAAPSPRSPSQVWLPQESSWEISLCAAAVLLLLGRGAGRRCSVPSCVCASLCCAPMLQSVPWQQLTHVCHFLWSKQTVPTNHRCVVLVLVLSSSSPPSSAGANNNTGLFPMQGSLHHIPTSPFYPSHILLIPVLGVKLWRGRGQHHHVP